MHNKKIIGLLAEYDSPKSIYHACENIRDAGFKRFDSYTPFAVHGLDKAMGLGPSYLPWLVLCAGISGAFLAMSFMIWTSAYDYPLNIGGKPFLSIPAFIPVTFEVTVLFSGLTAVFGMFFLNKMTLLIYALAPSRLKTARAAGPNGARYRHLQYGAGQCAPWWLSAHPPPCG